jgi:hypothetical protein
MLGSRLEQRPSPLPEPTLEPAFTLAVQSVKSSTASPVHSGFLHRFVARRPGPPASSKTIFP